MDRKEKLHQNDTLAPKTLRKSLRFPIDFVSFVGKQFFPLFVLFIIFFIITLNVLLKLIHNIILLLFLLFIFLVKFLAVLVSVTIKTAKFLHGFWNSNLQSVKKQIDIIKYSTYKKLPRYRDYIHISRIKIIPVQQCVFRLSNSFKILFLKLKLRLINPINVLVLKLRKINKYKYSTLFLLLVFTLSTFMGAVFWQLILKDLPSAKELSTRNIEVSTKIYDRNGILLYKIYKDKNRTPLKLEDIPKHVRLATLAIEDAEFYSHPGFSVKGITRAVIDNLKEGEITGGSTITQQLVKNALLTSEKTFIRKLREVTLAILVEINYTKDEILEMYLNEVSYGGTAYGIQEASRTYFDKEVKDLTLAEAALLAGLPKSPTSYSPFGNNPDYAVARQKEVLKLMRINKYITKDQENEALFENINYAKNAIAIKAPHFVMYVRQLLEDRYSKELVEKGGLKVTTTLDYEIQKLAEEVVKSEIENLKKLNVTNGAVVVLDPRTGGVLAMVGSVDYFDHENDGNVNVVTRPRQPGSSIKVVNYAYALSNGYTPASVITDAPVTFLVEGQEPYTPKNYEGKYRGNITLRSALAESRNIPAVKVLSSYGVENMVELGKEMGITTWSDPMNYGLSLTLGGGEVKLLDLATVYATLANYGARPEIDPIEEIISYSGKVVEKNECGPAKNESIIASAIASSSAFTFGHNGQTKCAIKQVIDPKVAFMLTDILTDNDARSPSFGSSSLLVIPNHNEVAVKTGTSNNLRDNLAIGYTQDYVVAVWVGNNDNSEMSRIASGMTGATPIFNKIMSALLAKNPNLKNSAENYWPTPKGLVKVEICTYTGTLPCSGCPNKEEWFVSDDVPKTHCSPEWFAKYNEKIVIDESTQGQILPEAASIEIIDTRKSKRNRDRD